MKNNKLNYSLVNILLTFAIIYLVILSSNYWGNFATAIINVSLPFLLAFVFAYVLSPFVTLLEKKGVRKGLAVLIVVLTVIGIVLGALILTVPVIYDQLLVFTKNIIIFFNEITTKYDINLGAFQFKISDVLNNIIKDLGNYISTGSIDVLGKSVNVITNTFIILIVGIYLLVDFEKIRNNIRRFLKRWSNSNYRLVKSLDIEMTNYFKGLLLLITVTFVEYTVIYRLINHPNWMLMGVLMGILCVIPYFGGITGNIIGMITASVVSTPLLVATVVVCLILPQIDGYIIAPKIYGKTNNVNPVAVIFAIALGGAIFGPVGIMIALPTYILLRAVIKFYQEPIKEKIEDIIDEK